jgi:hypothetical protein
MGDLFMYVKLAASQKVPQVHNFPEAEVPHLLRSVLQASEIVLRTHLLQALPAGPVQQGTLQRPRTRQHVPSLPSPDRAQQRGLRHPSQAHH